VSCATAVQIMRHYVKVLKAMDEERQKAFALVPVFKTLVAVRRCSGGVTVNEGRPHVDCVLCWGCRYSSVSSRFRYRPFPPTWTCPSSCEVPHRL
jgi:hypothetical protein